MGPKPQIYKMPSRLNPAAFKHGLQMSIPGNFDEEDISVSVNGQRVTVYCMNYENRHNFTGQFDLDDHLNLKPENVSFLRKAIKLQLFGTELQKHKIIAESITNGTGYISYRGVVSYRDSLPRHFKSLDFLIEFS